MLMIDSRVVKMETGLNQSFLFYLRAEIRYHSIKQGIKFHCILNRFIQKAILCVFRTGWLFV
jgi:hypothetical protein